MDLHNSSHKSPFKKISYHLFAILKVFLKSNVLEMDWSFSDF